MKRKIRGRIFDNIVLPVLRILNKDLDYLYDERFATLPWRDKAYTSEFAEILINEYNPESVVDVGCGIGDFLHPFYQKGLKILGIDGSKANFKHRKIPKDCFLVKDLRTEKLPEDSFDLCLCLEVAEHVPERYSNKLVQVLCSFSHKVVFTAATPGQGGHDHINEQPKDYWISKFMLHGFSFKEKKTIKLAKLLSQIDFKTDLDRKSSENYINNLMVFEKSKFAK